MTRLTTEQLEAIRKRAEEATEGPWSYDDGTFDLYSDGGEFGPLKLTNRMYPYDDFEFIVHAREDIPKLLAEIEKQNDWIEVLEYAKEFNLHAIKSQKAEIERLRNAISWGVSCSECSNQLAEEWGIINGSFKCQECIDYGGASE